jgi:hypothetical protein
LPGEILWKAKECERLGLNVQESKVILEAFIICGVDVRMPLSDVSDSVREKLLKTIK